MGIFRWQQEPGPSVNRSGRTVLIFNDGDRAIAMLVIHEESNGQNRPNAHENVNIINKQRDHE